MTSPVSSSKRAKKPCQKYPTWEFPEGSGIKIAEMPNKNRGVVFGVSYQVRIPSELLGMPDKREMHQRKTRADAERLAQDRFRALKMHGTEFAKIPAHVQKQAAIAWAKLSEHNARTKRSVNLIEAVEAGLRVLFPAGGLKTFAEVCAELQDSKAARLKAGGIDASTERDFRNRSNRLSVLVGNRLVSEITASEVEKVLAKMRSQLGQRSVLNFRNTLAEILRHAKAKKIQSN